MSGELHDILLRLNFVYVDASEVPETSLLHHNTKLIGYYVKAYTILEQYIDVALVIPKDPHISLPPAIVLDLPEIHRGTLIPHITSELLLCYVEEMEANWDPNNLSALYSDIDRQIEKTLALGINASKNLEQHNEELEGEFSSYWRPSQNLITLCDIESTRNIGTFKISGDSKNCGYNYVTTNSTDETLKGHLVNWSVLQNVHSEDICHSILTHRISVQPSKISKSQWPPKNFTEVIDWLSVVDHNSRTNIIRKIIDEKKSERIFILDIKNQGVLAFYIKLSIDLSRQRKSKKISISNLMPLLRGKNSTTDFTRLSVTKCDSLSLIGRNRPRNIDLKEHRVALIGCGTIGGYLSSLLVKSGAGCGKGKLDLFDPDNYKPDNFGRHILEITYSGKNKATSLATALKRSTHIVNYINGHTKSFPITPENLSQYDIVIDATGRAPVSKRLAKVARKLESIKTPIIVHCFNDGNGRAAKVFIDDGKACYSCLTSNPQTHNKQEIDLRFKDINNDAEKKVSCGNTYTPYDAAVSHIAAGIAQQAILLTLEPSLPWTYCEHILTGARSQKPKIVGRIRDCKVCGNGK